MSQANNTRNLNKNRIWVACKTLLTALLCTSLQVSAQQNEMLVRISEIEIDPAYLNNYKIILQEEAAASVKLEGGVIAIFPMFQKEDPTQARILEIYKNKSAYEQHLQTPHFKKYKTSTQHMVQTLKLVDMETLDAETMQLIFGKLNYALNKQQQSIIAIAALTAKGDLVNLKPEINKGLEAGLTINQIKECLIHLYAYCGFPRSLRGLQTFIEVLDERKAKGIIDNIGAEATPVTDSRNRYQRGKENLEKLTGVKETGEKTGYSAFAPVVEVLLKEHLFADLFERDVLTFSERQLVTISVLSAIGGVEPMLRSHLNICLNLGITPAQLQEFIGVIKLTIGKTEGEAAQETLNDVLKNRKQ